MSAHQIHRMLGVTYKTAWFMCHRIREAMKSIKPAPMGGEGEQIQADDTYIGNSSKRSKSYRKGHRHKQQIVALVEPKSGEVRAIHVGQANWMNIRNALVRNASRKSVLVTDDAKVYHQVGTEFEGHTKVIHSKNEYVNKRGFTTNNVENFFGVFKRGFKGTYSHWPESQHLQRYLTEFEFPLHQPQG